MGTRNVLVASKSFLLLASYLFRPIYAENMTNNTDGNNTLFSKRNNRTEIVYESCEWSDIRPTYSIVAAVVSAFLILDGGVMCTLGYKKERTTFSLLGFTIAGLVGYAIVEYKFDYSIGIRLLITGSMAVFVSIICSSVMYCGVFLTGLSTGFCLGCVVIIVISEVHSFNSFAEPIFILIGLGIVFASASLWWKRTFVILGTSVTGAAFIMAGLDYFVEGFLFVENVQHIIYGRDFRRLCYFSWIVFSVFPVLAIAGVGIQHFKTAKLNNGPKSLSNQELAMNRLSEASHQSHV